MFQILGGTGGPLAFTVLAKTDTKLVKVPILVGLASFGITQCKNTNIPDVYVRLAPYTQWIESVTHADLNVHSCLKKYEDKRQQLQKENSSSTTVCPA